MQTSLWELQTAIHSAFNNDTKLMNKITGVYDSVSKEAVKPYVTIGDPTSTPYKTKINYGENIVTSLHVWSDHNGKKECIDILNLMLGALKEPLNIEGSFLIIKRELVSMIVLNDPIEDGVKHGTMELRFIINNQ